MQYAKCKCGDYEVWTSLGIKRCAWCEKCQSTPAHGPNGHRTERPKHKMISRSDAQLERALEGAKRTEEALRGHHEHQTAVHAVQSIEKDLKVCTWCFKSQRDLEATNAPMEDFNP